MRGGGENNKQDKELRRMNSEVRKQLAETTAVAAKAKESLGSP